LPLRLYAAAIDFKYRSPFSQKVSPGIPRSPTNDAAVVSVASDGTPVVAGMPLRSLPINQPAAQMQPIPNYDPTNYGDVTTFRFTFPIASGAFESIVLRRPVQTRISLLVVNLSVVGNVFYCFDRTADNVTCIPIPNGGNRLFDTKVPQGDLHVFSTGAGDIVIEYMNRDISQLNSR
jgi:hypothetical protein